MLKIIKQSFSTAYPYSNKIKLKKASRLRKIGKILAAFGLSGFAYYNFFLSCQ